MVSQPSAQSRREKKRATRQALLASARELFAAHGFGGTTTRAVAQRAGVASGTVFAHFADKQALLEATLTEQLEEALDDAFATLPDGDVVSQLVHVCAKLYAGYAANPSLARVLVQHSLFAEAPSTRTRTEPPRPLDAQRARFERWLTQRLHDAAAQGELVRQQDPQLLFFTVFSLYLSVLVAGLRGDVPFAEQAGFLETLLRQHIRL